MVGFETAPGPFFWYLFIVWLNSMVFCSLGQWFAAMLSNGASAQAIVSLVMPLCALFGGIYLPKSQLPNGTKNGHPHVYWLWARLRVNLPSAPSHSASRSSTTWTRSATQWRRWALLASQITAAQALSAAQSRFPRPQGLRAWMRSRTTKPRATRCMATDINKPRCS